MSSEEDMSGLEPKMPSYIYLRSQETHSYEVSQDDQIYDLKLFIERAENIPNEDQVLYCCGRPLDDEQRVSECSLSDGDSVEVCVRLRGGKVHGSLARAGKVKGQTPKVDKQEKKKKKTGRAKRRMQYNRRFVNVVQTFGRRRGPNTNQT